MEIPVVSLGKNPESLDLEADASGLPGLLEAGGFGAVKVHLEISPLEGDSHLISGEAEGLLKVSCGRCTDALEQAFSVTFNLLSEARDEKGLAWLEVEDQGVEDYCVAIGPDTLGLPLDPIIAEQVLLNYNLHPLPELDRLQRCVKCGRTPPTAGEPKKANHLDPRWAKLKALKDRGENA